jgi:hypothetical protein
MVDLDDRLRRDLARLRERASPPAGAEQRVRAALDAAIGPGGGPGGGDGGGSASGAGGAMIGGKLALASKLILAATLAAASVGLLVKLGRTPARRSSEVATPPATLRATSSAEAPPSTAPPTPEPELPIVVTLPADPRAPVQRPSEPTEDPLTAEVALLEQARTTDELAARLRLLEQHRTRFADGLLAAERESLRVSTLCELGQLDAARRAAEEFLLTHPRSPLLLRMRSACPDLDVLAE